MPARKGELHHRAKLTAKQVQQIRKRYDSECITQLALAVEYDMDPKSINDIIHRKLWRHVP